MGSNLKMVNILCTVFMAKEISTVISAIYMILCYTPKIIPPATSTLKLLSSSLLKIMHLLSLILSVYIKVGFILFFNSFVPDSLGYKGYFLRPRSIRYLIKYIKSDWF